MRADRRGVGKFSPQDPVERGLVDRVVDAEWKIARLRRAERVAYGIGADRRADRDEADYLQKTWQHGRAARHRDALRRVLNHDALGGDGGVAPRPRPPHPDDAVEAADAAEARAAQAARERRHEGPPGTLAGALDVAQAIADPAGVIERFSRIAARLEQSAARAIRQLRELRADARDAGDEEPLPCPYLELEDDEDEEQEQEDEQDVDEQDEQDEEDDHDEEHEEHVDDGQDAEDDGGAAGVVTSVTMSDPPTTDTAQNEPNFPQSLAGADEDEAYDAASCNVDLAALMRRAAADAAERTAHHRLEWKLA